MRAIVEWDGVLADVREAHWHAYSQAVAAIGLARTDEATFWRLTRKGADAGQLILGAKPRHIDAYREHFDAALETDEIIAHVTPHEDAAERLRQGCRAATIVTAGSNVAARCRIALARTPGTTSQEITRLQPPLSAALRTCADAFGPGTPVIVLAATQAVVIAADEAELPPIGIASGPCAAKRLAARGARATFRSLDAFYDARQAGDAELAKLGIEPLPTSAPEPQRPPQDRDADRAARRRARMAGRRRQSRFLQD